MPNRVMSNFLQFFVIPCAGMTFFIPSPHPDTSAKTISSRGAMATSLRGLGTYYDSWGETFERLALSKARFVAGHESLEPAFNRLVEPFIYRKYLDYAAIDEVRVR